MNFEENETVKSYFTYSLSSLLGFWVVLEPFQVLSIFFQKISELQINIVLTGFFRSLSMLY